MKILNLINIIFIINFINIIECNETVISIASYNSCILKIDRDLINECTKLIIENKTDDCEYEMYSGVTYCEYWYSSKSIFDRNSKDVINQCVNCNSEDEDNCMNLMKEAIIERQDNKSKEWIKSLEFRETDNLTIEIIKENICVMKAISVYHLNTKQIIEISDNQKQKINKFYKILINESKIFISDIFESNELVDYFNDLISLYFQIQISDIILNKTYISNNILNSYQNITIEEIENINLNLDKYCYDSKETNKTNILKCKFWLNVFIGCIEGILNIYRKTNDENIILIQRYQIIKLIRNIKLIFINSGYILSFDDRPYELLNIIKKYIITELKYNYSYIYNELDENNPLKLFLHYHVNSKTDNVIINYLNKTFTNQNTDQTTNQITNQIIDQNNEIKIISENQEINKYLKIIVKNYIKQIKEIYGITEMKAKLNITIILESNSTLAEKLGYKTSYGLWIPYENRVYMFKFFYNKKVIYFRSLEILLHEIVHVIQALMNNEFKLTKKLYHPSGISFYESYATFISMKMIRGLKNTILTLLYTVYSSDMNEYDVDKAFNKKLIGDINSINAYRRNPLFLAYLYSCDRIKFNPLKIKTYIFIMSKEMNIKFKQFIKLNLNITNQSIYQINDILLDKYDIRVDELVELSKTKQLIEDEKHIKCPK